MAKVKLILVPNTPQPEEMALTLRGVVRILNNLPEGGFKILTSKETELNHYGPLYKMVGYDPTQDEENQFLPVAENQLRLLTKFIPRDEKGNMLIGLAKEGIQHPIPWTVATLTDKGYIVYRRTEI